MRWGVLLCAPEPSTAPAAPPVGAFLLRRPRLLLLPRHDLGKAVDAFCAVDTPDSGKAIGLTRGLG